MTTGCDRQGGRFVMRVPREPERRLHNSPDGLPPGFQPGTHPGHWELHHLALPAGMPGDFTPVRLPEYAEHEATPHGDLLRYLAGLLDVDHAQRISDRGREMEAGQ